MGLITAVVGFAQSRKDTIKVSGGTSVPICMELTRLRVRDQCVRAGRTKIVFLIRGALVSDASRHSDHPRTWPLPSHLTCVSLRV